MTIITLATLERSNILQITVKKSHNVQSKSELSTTEHFLPFTYEVMAEKGSNSCMSGHSAGGLKSILRRQLRPRFLKWYKTFNRLLGSHDNPLTRR